MKYPRRSWVAALLIACGLAAFVPNVAAFFLSDDFVLLSWTHLDSLAGVPAFFDPRTAWFYRPAVKLVYWAGQSLFGLHAAPFHIFSILLHGANAYMVYRLAAHQGAWAGGVAADLIFLLDPHHAETVSWTASVGDLIGVGCILANLLLWERFRQRGKPRYLLVAWGLFAVGLLARETVVLLPALLLLYTAIFEGNRLGRRRIGMASAGYAAVLGAYLLIQVIGRAGRGSEQTTLTQGGLQFHPLNLDSILLGILDYLHRLAPGGNFLVSASLDVLRVLVWIEWGLLLLLMLGLWRAKLRLMLFGLAWLLVTPLAFIFFSPPTDRYFYLPSVGYALSSGFFLAGLPRLAAKVHLARLAGPAKVVSAATLAALIAWQGAALVGGVGRWRAAGLASGGVLHDIRQAAPDPRDYTALYMVALPTTLAGVPVFQNGLQEAVQAVYENNTIAAYSVSCDTLKKTELARYSLFFRYKDDAGGVRQFSSPGDCP